MLWSRIKKLAASRVTPTADVEQALAELEQKAAATSPEYRAQYYSRAAELCTEINDRSRALRYWGRAIDLYLTTARPRAAATVCRKLVEFAPDVVRARRTLALLAIGEGHMSEAAEYLAEYVSAAERAGQTDLSVKQLRLMGEATSNLDFRRRTAELLQRHGDKAGAERLQRVSSEPPRAEEHPGAEAAHDRWSTILRAALMPPEEVRRTL